MLRMAGAAGLAGSGWDKKGGLLAVLLCLLAHSDNPAGHSKDVLYLFQAPVTDDIAPGYSRVIECV